MLRVTSSFHFGVRAFIQFCGILTVAQSDLHVFEVLEYLAFVLIG